MNGFNSSDRGSVTRFGVTIGGIRGNVVNAVFSPDPTGEFLSPPFLYNTCVDWNKDGFIRTSRRLGYVLGWPDPGSPGIDSNGGADTAVDESILNYTTARQARTIAVDHNNDVWVGGIWEPNGENIIPVAVNRTDWLKRRTAQKNGGNFGLIDSSTGALNVGIDRKPSQIGSVNSLLRNRK